jgi:Na+-translocating ferredoxin:NAD+ oxidoreductase RNF subunit RnfB
MNEIVTATIITISSVGIVSAIILYWASQKFKVFEDPRIDQVEESLPASNCGGCGYAGCRNFAEACVNSESLDKLFCPVGGNETMKKVADILGRTSTEKVKKIAVLRCNGSPANRNRTNIYDGAQNCTIVSNLYSGDTDCQYGCLGLGECVEVCNFEAIFMNPVTLLPEIIDDKCTACNKCVEVCPKNLLELRPLGPKGKRIYVSCLNEDKGAPAKKACVVACIGCGKCVKVCPHDAIVINNFLAYIDPIACKLCRKCVTECPTNSILELNFPARKISVPKEKSEAETSVEQ